MKRQKEDMSSEENSFYFNRFSLILSRRTGWGGGGDTGKAAEKEAEADQRRSKLTFLK